ncbi:MAG TPA: amino acid permease [Burkholderiales bacterium]|nr:amino acid permease [Burkholderiales bacterium]
MASQPGAVGAAPKPLLSVGDGVLLTCGMVIGAGIFRTPTDIAGATDSAAMFLFAWVLGGAISLCGALVYAELAARHPAAGGEYTFLSRGWGSGAAFVFAWARMTVIQTGAIALVAFVFGDYASQILRLGDNSAALYAAASVLALTALNYLGTLESKRLQIVMQYLVFAALAFIALAGLFTGAPEKPAAAPAAAAAPFGLAMIFVLLTFGGWNEAAYLGGEVRDARRNMLRVLIGGIVVVTVFYLLVNIGYLAALGLQGMRESKAVAADVLRVALGDRGALAVSIIVCLACLTTMNAAIFTGARTTYAFGHDFRMFRLLGIWREAGSTPANAILLQGAITLALVAASSVTPDGFQAMVAYTSPVFWTFFLLTALTLFVFRRREGGNPAFRVPLYPVVPIAFVLACVYMIYSAINYARFAVEFGAPAVAGTLIMLAGIPLYFLARKK